MVSIEMSRRRRNINYVVICIALTLVNLMLYFNYNPYCASGVGEVNRTIIKENNQSISYPLNAKNIEFLINSKNSCDECTDEFLLVVLVHSALPNVNKRTAIRETWGKQSKCIKLLYFVGTQSNDSITKQIQEENEKFHDIIQGDFIDTYRNLTYKHIMVLKWATNYCQKAKYIVKSDDDTFVNIAVLYDKLKGNFISGSKVIACSVVRSAKVLRARSKWIVTKTEYPAPKFPDYCSGMFIIYSADVAARLLAESYEHHFLWVDDVFVSGVLAKRLGIKHVDLKYKWFLKRADRLLERGPGHVKPFIFGPRDLSPDQMYKIWRALQLK